jgi:hypothetical protein
MQQRANEAKWDIRNHRHRNPITWQLQSLVLEAKKKEVTNLLSTIQKEERLLNFWFQIPSSDQLTLALVSLMCTNFCGVRFADYAVTNFMKPWRIFTSQHHVQ